MSSCYTVYQHVGKAQFVVVARRGMHLDAPLRTEQGSFPQTNPVSLQVHDVAL